MANLTQEIQNSETKTSAGATKVDLKFEVVVIPVSDVDRAKEFYTGLGWRLDIDSGNGTCSIIFGKNVTAAAPGSVQGLYLIVSDIESARKELLALGAEISDTFHGDIGAYVGPDEPFLFGRRRVSGPDPDHISYRSYASFHDPAGNGWLLQEGTTRLPGHMDPTATSFVSVNDLAGALRRAEVAHGLFENRSGKADENWPQWYAEFMVREQSGENLPQ